MNRVSPATTAGRKGDFAVLLSLLRKVEFPLSSFLAPALLALATAVFEGAGVMLMVPAVSVSIKLNFDSLIRSRVFQKLSPFFPVLRSCSGRELFIVLLALIGLATLLKTCLQYASSVSCARQARQFASRMRHLLFKRCLSFGKLFFDMENAGHVQDVILGATGTIAAKIIALQDALTWACMLLAYLSIMFWISWKLTCGILLLFPVMHYSSRKLLARVKSASRSSADSRKTLSGYVSNVLSCILLVQIRDSQREEARRFADANDSLEWIESDIDQKAGLMRFVQELTFLVVLLVVLFALAFIAGQQRSGLAASLLVYVYLLRRASAAITIVGRFETTLAEIHGPVTMVGELLDDAGKYYVPDGSRKFTGLSAGIEFRNMHFYFPNKTKVLDDVSFTVKKGMMTAIVGPSGTGKTTLINLIMRFYDSPPGSILLDGVDIRDLTLSSLRAKMALIGQDPMLFNDTIRKNLSYACKDDVPERRLLDALKQAALYDHVMQLPQGLDAVIGDRGVKLSGGEKQRLAIARAMLTQAEILIFDEATSSLDSPTELVIQGAIDTLLKGKTSIVIAHRLSTVKNADQIVVIEGGRLVETGSWQELLEKKNRFYHYWEAQKFR